MEKKCKKAKWLSGEALQIAVKRREVKSKGEKEIELNYQRFSIKSFVQKAIVMSYVTVIINEFNSTITKYKLYVEKQNQIICCLQETQSKRHRKVDNNSMDMNQDKAGVAILFPKQELWQNTSKDKEGCYLSIKGSIEQNMFSP